MNGILMFLIAVAQCIDCNSGSEVQIFLSIQIIQVYTFAMIQYNRITIIRMQYHLFCPFHTFLIFHFLHAFLTMFLNNISIQSSDSQNATILTDVAFLFRLQSAVPVTSGIRSPAKAVLSP